MSRVQVGRLAPLHGKVESDQVLVEAEKHLLPGGQDVADLGGAQQKYVSEESSGGGAGQAGKAVTE